MGLEVPQMTQYELLAAYPWKKDHAEEEQTTAEIVRGVASGTGVTRRYWSPCLQQYFYSFNFDIF